MTLVVYGDLKWRGFAASLAFESGPGRGPFFNLHHELWGRADGKLKALFAFDGNLKLSPARSPLRAKLYVSIHRLSNGCDTVGQVDIL